MKKIKKMFLILFAVFVLSFVSYISVGIKPMEVNAYETQAAEESEEKIYEWNLRLEGNSVLWDRFPDIYSLYTITVKGDNFELICENWISNDFFLLLVLEGKAAGDYYITVKMQSSELAIPESEPYKVYYDGIGDDDSPKALSIPENLRQSQDRLMWDPVEHAIGYQIVIAKSIYPMVSKDRVTIDVTENYFLLSNFILYNYDYGKYYFNVAAIAPIGDSEYRDSWISKFKEFVYEAKVDNIEPVIDNANKGIGFKEILLFSTLGAIVVLMAIFLIVFISKRKAVQAQSVVEKNSSAPSFNLDTCTEAQLRERCRERFQRDVEYKTERAIKHFILKLPHNEIDDNPKQSQMERMRMRKVLK